MTKTEVKKIKFLNFKRLKIFMSLTASPAAPGQKRPHTETEPKEPECIEDAADSEKQRKLSRKSSSISLEPQPKTNQEQELPLKWDCKCLQPFQVRFWGFGGQSVHVRQLPHLRPVTHHPLCPYTGSSTSYAEAPKHLPSV